MAIGDSVVIWQIYPTFGKLHQEKSGNPGQEKFNGQLVYSVVHTFTFWYIVSRKIWQPWSREV
jgi:hypothetical protein